MLGGTGGGRITAFFGAPVETEDHARRACLSALRVRALEHALNGTAASVFGSRMGIHTGECFAGFLGSRSIPDYSLVGPPADLAARLEGLNTSFGTSIIVTETVREAAGPGFQVRMLGSVPDANSPDRIRVYELSAETGMPDALSDRLIAEFEEGLARYEKGDFAGALAIFSRVLAAAPGDGPTAAYARRCRHLAAPRGEPDLTSLPW
jgi:adenylate cyclase